MQYITTKYYGPTNFKGSRIKAQASGGVSCWIGYNDSENSQENHERAVLKLCRGLDWYGTFIEATGKDGSRVWVYEDGPRLTVPKMED